MPDAFFVLDSLSPRESLALLAEASTNFPHPAIVEIGVRAESTAFGPLVSLWVPDPFGAESPERNDGRRGVLEGVLTLFRRLKSREPRRDLWEPSIASLGRMLPWLLINSEQQNDPAGRSNELLLVGRGLGLGQLAEVFEELRFHATQTRVGSVELEGESVYLFHVLDDRDRHSSLMGLLAGNGLEQLALLWGYQWEQLLVFLPPDQNPGAGSLGHFCTICRRVPRVLGLVEGAVQTGPLIALLSRSSQASAPLNVSRGPTYDVVPLPAVSFHGQVNYIPRAAFYADFRLMTLSDKPAALAGLERAIENVRPRVGYRLELRPCGYSEPHENERLRLLEQQARVDYRLAYLDSIAQPKPVLLRFSQRQLPALAHLLSRLPHHLLESPSIKYEFQATDQNPEGFHFFLLEPAADGMNHAQPFLEWEDLDKRPMFFQLEPFWARYYHGKGGETAVFVPRETVLFPALHAWHESDMDDYLRQMIGRWFVGRPETCEIPSKPIYVFEGDPVPRAPIFVSILDLENFQPIGNRLGWINDNLRILDAVGMEPFLREIARDLNRTAMARQISDEAELVEVSFQQTALESGEKLAAKLNTLTDVFTQEVNHVVNQSHRSIQKLKTLNQYLHGFSTLTREMERSADEAHQHLKQVHDSYQGLGVYIRKLERSIGYELASADRTKSKIKLKVLRAIRELTTTRERLRERLLDILKSR